MNREKRIAILQEISDDMANDMSALEGQPFTGKNVAAAIGNLAAGISALARILKDEIESQKELA